MCLVASNYDLHWAAGFIDADGCFTKNKTIVVCADQKDMEPLLKLQQLFGGVVFPYKIKAGSYYRWYKYADEAAVIMSLLYPLMTERRKARIKELLSVHANKKPRSYHNIIKTHCPQGHPYSGDNLRLKKSGGRECRTCQRSQKLKYYNAKKLKGA